MVGWTAKLFLSWACLLLSQELLKKNTVTPWGLCQPWALQWGLCRRILKLPAALRLPSLALFLFPLLKQLMGG